MKSIASLRNAIQKTILHTGKDLVKESNHKLHIHTKSTESDLVTQLDLQTENHLKEAFSKLLPGSIFLSEETEPALKTAEKLWIIDPIDGTTNFVHGFPFIAISVALQLDGELTLGFVYNPILNEFFEATRKEGSYLNKKRIHVSHTQRISQSLLATGFAYNFGTATENNIRFFEHFHHKCHGIRRPGSAALDLCYVARGIFDGFWEWYLHPWDVAAGILIVKEAGGMVTDLLGDPYLFGSENILVTNTQIHNEMMQEIKDLIS